MGISFYMIGGIFLLLIKLKESIRDGKVDKRELIYNISIRIIGVLLIAKGIYNLTL